MRKNSGYGLLLCSVSASVLILAGGAATAAFGAEAAPVAKHGDVAEVEQLIVTARRVTENVQTVPESVSAYSAAALKERSVRNVNDLTFITPGVVFAYAGSAYNTNYTIRGQSRAVTGEALPTVVTYFNEIPLIVYGSNAPAYDLDNIQVLKGPQGTLFGRNTTGGAVLIYSKAPTHEFGGYVEGTLGDYNWHGAEGAVNLPLVKDTLALRIAGKAQKRDGYVRNMNTRGGDFDALDDQAFRISLLADPLPNLRNVAVYDYYSSVTVGSASYMVVADPNGPTGRKYRCGTSINCDLLQAFAYSQSHPRQEFVETGPDGVGQSLKIRNQGISNTTTYDAGFAEFKNIVGYRKNHIYFRGDIDGTPIPATYVYRQINREQFSEEFHANGQLFSNKLNWLGGIFYVKDKPSGPWIVASGSFANPININSGGAQTYYSNTSKAIFGSLTYDLLDFVKGLKIDGAYRYTWDEQSLCSVNTKAFLGPFYSANACPTAPGALNLKINSKAPTWNVSVNYQANDYIFLYATYRRGYRGGGINTPRLAATGTPGLVHDLSSYQAFQPEFLTDTEVGIKTTWQTGDWRGLLNVAAFRDKYANIQIAQNLPVNFDGDNNPADDPVNNFLQLNSGRGVIKGVEAQLSLTGFNGLSLNLAGAYTDAKITSLALPAIFAGLNPAGTSFFATPKYTMAANVRYVLPIDSKHGDVVLNVDQYYSDKILYLVYTARSYTTTNLRMDWKKVEGSNVDLSFFVINLFDKLFIDASNSTTLGSTGFATMHLGAPRTMGVQARYEF